MKIDIKNKRVIGIVLWAVLWTTVAMILYRMPVYFYTLDYPRGSGLILSILAAFFVQGFALFLFWGGERGIGQLQRIFWLDFILSFVLFYFLLMLKSDLHDPEWVWLPKWLHVYIGLTYGMAIPFLVCCIIQVVAYNRAFLKAIPDDKHKKVEIFLRILFGGSLFLFAVWNCFGMLSNQMQSDFFIRQIIFQIIGTLLLILSMALMSTPISCYLLIRKETKIRMIFRNMLVHSILEAAFLSSALGGIFIGIYTASGILDKLLDESIFIVPMIFAASAAIIHITLKGKEN